MAHLQLLTTFVRSWFQASFPTHVGAQIECRVPTAHARRGERGASLVEYALLVALIALVCVGGVTLLGAVTESQFSSIADGFKE